MKYFLMDSWIQKFYEQRQFLLKVTCVVQAYLDHKASITSSCGKALTQERTKTKKRKKETYNLVLEIYCSFCLLLLSIVVL